MTIEDFRRLALSIPEAEERAHMGHPDFRVRGKIFATLGYPDEGWGMVKLNPEQQYELVRVNPDVFTPVKGTWGRHGATSVRLARADERTLEPAMRMASQNVTAKKSRRQKAP